MKYLIVIAMLLISITSNAETDDKFKTVFIFKSVVGTKETQYKVMEDAKVVMPKGSTWSCDKLSASIDSDNDITGAFLCKNGTSKILIAAVCARGKLHEDVGSAIISNETKDKTDTIIGFVVACKTVANEQHSSKEDGLSL